MFSSLSSGLFVVLITLLNDGLMLLVEYGLIALPVVAITAYPAVRLSCAAPRMRVETVLHSRAIRR